MLRFIFALSGFFLTSVLSAQWCGTPQEPILERTDANKLTMLEGQRSAQKYVPITFHLVANAAGNGRVTEENVLLQVANMNAAYADQETKFYIDRLNYFDNDAVYNSPATTAARTQMRARKDNNSVNVYITNQADSGSGTPGVTLAYYDPSEDWIVSRKSEINGASSTLSHETGHFFSLAHPFNGWDCHPFTLDEYTNPVSVDFTLPCEGGGGSVLIELHNRSNCNTAGDHICDTPEDYNLGLLYQNDCSENTSVKDKNGEVINPMTNNFMSYYRECSSYAFTQTQKNLMNTDFFSFPRAYIRTGNVPNITPVTGPVQYISPINGVQTATNNVVLDWEDTPGANRYLVIYDRFASFTFNPVKTIVTTSELEIAEELTEDVTYYWKVWPFNESMTDAGYSAAQNFRATNSVGVNEIREIDSYALNPNPIADHAPATLTLSATKAFTGILKIADASGHDLTSEKILIPEGISQHPVQTTDLPVGIYFVIIESEKGRFVERLLILD